MNANTIAASVHDYRVGFNQLVVAPGVLPALRSGEVEISVTAASINPLDVLMTRATDGACLASVLAVACLLRVGRDGCGAVVVWVSG